MVIESAAGVVGITSVIGGLGGAAYFVALVFPLVSFALGTLAVVGGLHGWATRKR